MLSFNTLKKSLNSPIIKKFIFFLSFTMFFISSWINSEKSYISNVFFYTGLGILTIDCLFIDYKKTKVTKKDCIVGSIIFLSMIIIIFANVSKIVFESYSLIVYIFSTIYILWKN